MIGSIRTTKLRYRLLADGTILDQVTGKVAGYFTSQSDIQEAWGMNGPQRQKFINTFLSDKQNGSI